MIATFDVCGRFASAIASGAAQDVAASCTVPGGPMDPSQSAQRHATWSVPADSHAPHPQVVKYVGLLDIAPADTRHARAFWSIVEPQIGGIVDRFYAKLRQSEAGAFLEDDIVARLKTKQVQHWARLFASQFDEDYVCSVQRVGIRHRDIKLGTAWFVSGYMAIKMEFVEAVLKADIPSADKGEILKAVEKYVALDMSIALSAYEDESYVID
jgi:hypothetical protein